MKFISTPQTLYHGTIEQNIGSFRTRLLDKRYWRPGRDFGPGFYTTNSLVQARKWARKAEKNAVPASRACVLEIQLTGVPEFFVPQVFLGMSVAWAEYIFAHRKVTNKGEDPCIRHADLVIGPVADNDTGKIIQYALSLNKDHHWFYDKITRSVKGSKLDASKLGNQVVFCTEQWESSLRLLGYYIFTRGRWVYHDVSTTAESL